jgi:hypothetical protein
VLLFDFLLLYLLFEFQNLGLALLKRLWHALTIFLDELAKFSRALSRSIFASLYYFAQIFQHFEFVAFFLDHILNFLNLLSVIFALRLLMVAQNSHLTITVIVNLYFRVLGVLRAFLALQFVLEGVARIVGTEYFG